MNAISTADPSIISNETTVKLYQKFQPTNDALNYTFNFAVPLVNNISTLPDSHANNSAKTVSSTSFIYKGNLSYLEDNGSGTLRIVNLKENELTVVANTGTVDYSTGIVKLTNFAVDSFSGNDLLVLVEPADLDITATQNNILSIEPDQINLSTLPLALDE